jgi:hypothetical protein
MPPEQARNLGIRFDAEFSTWLRQFEDNTGIQAVVLGRALFDAARRFYDKHHYLVFPLDITVTGMRSTVAASVLAEAPEPGQPAKEDASSRVTQGKVTYGAQAATHAAGKMGWERKAKKKRQTAR